MYNNFLLCCYSCALTLGVLFGHRPNKYLSTDRINILQKYSPCIGDLTIGNWEFYDREAQLIKIHLIKIFVTRY